VWLQGAYTDRVELTGSVEHMGGGVVVYLPDNERKNNITEK